MHLCADSHAGPSKEYLIFFLFYYHSFFYLTDRPTDQPIIKRARAMGSKTSYGHGLSDFSKAQKDASFAKQWGFVA